MKNIPHTDKTLHEWLKFARTDYCLDRMVPSDLRMILNELHNVVELAKHIRINQKSDNKCGDLLGITEEMLDGMLERYVDE